jgi:hypothetical protein
MKVKKVGGIIGWEMDVECISQKGKIPDGNEIPNIKECGSVLTIKASDVVYEDGEFYITCKVCGKKLNVSNIIPQFVQVYVKYNAIND